MLIKAQNLSLRIGEKQLLDNIAVEIDKGQIIGLIGPNGAGKSTLLKVLANILPADSGQYRLANKNIRQYKEKELAQKVGYLAQNATAHWPLKAQRLIELGRLPFQGYRQKLGNKDRDIINAAIAKTETAHLLDRVVTTLSGGEQTRIFLARLFAAEPEVIFADEPIAALDPYHQLHIMEILREHAQKGGTVVVVMHDINLASRFCDQLILMDKGKIRGTGDINDLLKNNVLTDTFRIKLRLFCEGDSYAITPWEREL